MTKTLFALYQRLVLQHPVIWVLLALLVSGYAAWESRHFRLDASADSLILENDKALEFYREVSKRYGGSEFLIITYEPTQSALFSRETLSDLATLQGRLAELPRVASVYSMLDVPLLFSPQVRFSDLANGYSTLRDEDANLSLAKEEFTGGSPLYRDLLVNRDGDTTALLINFERDATYYELLNHRNALRDQERAGELDNAGAQQLARANREFSDYSAKRQAESAAEIATIRAIMDQHRDSAQLFLGGAPMIASDAVGFVRSDLEVFGIGVTLFLILALLVIFRRLRWIALPMLCCGLTVLWVSGWLGLMDWKVTVISSNFVSLLLIITMSMTIHLIVRYRELQAEQPDADQPALVRDTMGHMLRPVIYTSLTTMVAFASLVFSGIRPVIDFGWMMTIGIGLALVLCLVLFPAVLALLPKQPPQTLRDFTRRATLRISDFNRGHGIKLLVGCALVVIVSLIGTSRLTVENRFIDYFQKDTEIYQGMVEIDRNLGGTTPLDIVIDAPAGHQPRALEDDPFADPFAGGFGDEDVDDDPFADPFAATQQADPLENAYWYTPQRLEQLLEIQHYLESLPETGKVLSIASTYEVAKMINNGPLSYVDLMLLASFVPEDLRGQLVRPYLSEDGNQVRISVRVIDSDKNLNRNDLLQKIQHDLQQNFDLAPEQVKLTGAMVLYNNMLQSLFDSQIKTLGFVFLAIFVMFLVLFRSPGISLIAMLPNLFSAAFILGLMGWIGLPLDIMTITIAAITIGIAVDDSIHYIHRFREEFPKDQDYLATMRRCHGSIGTAIYYTSLTIIAGFSILVVSNFNPTVYFGALTSLAMLVALLANLTLLPAMLVTVKPKIPPV